MRCRRLGRTSSSSASACWPRQQQANCSTRPPEPGSYLIVLNPTDAVPDHQPNYFANATAPGRETARDRSRREQVASGERYSGHCSLPCLVPNPHREGRFMKRRLLVILTLVGLLSVLPMTRAGAATQTTSQVVIIGNPPVVN